MKIKQRGKGIHITGAYPSEKYILNGQVFKYYDLAVEYAANNGWRITNTSTIAKRTYLLTVSSI